MEQEKRAPFGFNHVALEVGDIEEALTFYGRLFDFKLRGKSGTSAFIDLGDHLLSGPNVWKLPVSNAKPT